MHEMKQTSKLKQISTKKIDFLGEENKDRERKGEERDE